VFDSEKALFNLFSRNRALLTELFEKEAVPSVPIVPPSVFESPQRSPSFPEGSQPAGKENEP
jgi:hypothetical protein